MAKTSNVEMKPRRILTSSVNIVTEYCKRLEEKNQGEPLVNISAETFLNLAKRILARHQAQIALHVEGAKLQPIELLTPELVQELFAVDIRGRARTGELCFYTEQMLDDETCAELLRQIQQMKQNDVSWSALPQDNERLNDLRIIYRSYHSLCGDWSSKNRFTRENLLETAYKNLKLDAVNQLMTEEEAASYELLEDGELSVIEQNIWEEIVKRSGKKQGTVLSAYEMESLQELEQKPVLFSGYGVENEVCFVAEEIVAQNMPAGEVTVLYSNEVYENFLAAEFGNKGIPYRLLSGRTAATLPLVKLAKDILHFFEHDYFCEDFEKLATCPELRIKEEANTYGSLSKIYREMHRNKIMWGRQAYELFLEETVNLSDGEREFMRRLITIFGADKSVAALYHDLYRFVNDYSRKGKAQSEERGVLKAVLASLDLVKEKTGKEAVNYLLQRLEQLSYGDSAFSGAVSLIKIGTSLEFLERKTTFVIGLSAKDFAANTTESPVLADEEMTWYPKGNIVLAREKDSKLKEALMNSLRTMKKDAKLYLGYSSFDTVESREQNPSTFLRGVAELAGVEMPKKPKGYGKLNMKPEDVLQVLRSGQHEEGPLLVQRDGAYSFSASSMQTLLYCPAKYLYEKNLGILEYEPVEQKPSVWLEPMERGEVYHSILEDYFVRMTDGYRKPLPKEPDQTVISQVLDERMRYALQKKPALSEMVYEKTRKEFLENITQYLEKTHGEFAADGWQIAGCEAKFQFFDKLKEDCTILFGGSIDRIDVRVRADGKKECRIIDYKSGKYSSVSDKIRDRQFVQDYVYLKSLESEGVLPGDKAEYDLETAYMRFEFLEEKSASTFMVRRISDTSACYENMSKQIEHVLNPKETEVTTLFKEKKKDKACRYCPYVALCMADKRMVM